MPDPELRTHKQTLKAHGLDVLQGWQARKPPREASYDELDVLVKTRQKLKRVRCSLRAGGLPARVSDRSPASRPFTSWRSRTALAACCPLARRRASVS
jgi:hypothetical protein